MKVGYVDTSCLVAVAFGEPGAGEITTALEACDRLVSSNLLEAELRSAFTREKVADPPDLLLEAVAWVHPDRPLTREMGKALAAGYLRGADLWHLACALFLAAGLPELVFLSLDERQITVARALGFETAGD